MNVAALRDRVVVLLDKARGSHQGDAVAVGTELLQGTLSLIALLYGPESQQARSVSKLGEERPSGKPLPLPMRMGFVIAAVRGVLENLLGEIDAGLVGNLQQQITGGVLADFIQLARAALDEPGDGAKNVAAVLAAAAFEDTIRRMGEGLAGVVGRPELHRVLEDLKTKQILVATQFTFAQSYLPFRNRALHAEWDKIEREAVHPVLAFVEQLISKHF